MRTSSKSTGASLPKTKLVEKDSLGSAADANQVLALARRQLLERIAAQIIVERLMPFYSFSLDERWKWIEKLQNDVFSVIQDFFVLPSDRGRPRDQKLVARDIQISQLAAQGKTLGQIAQKFHISRNAAQSALRLQRTRNERLADLVLEVRSLPSEYSLGNQTTCSEWTPRRSPAPRDHSILPELRQRLESVRERLVEEISGVITPDRIEPFFDLASREDRQIARRLQADISRVIAGRFMPRAQRGKRHRPEFVVRNILMRQLVDRGHTLGQIAREFGISRNAVQSAVRARNKQDKRLIDAARRVATLHSKPALQLRDVLGQLIRKRG
jgi:DNA-binding CsgD family transcriptional regulator